MNRREFIRTAIATTTLMAVGAAGIFEIASKAGANQAAAQAQQLQLPPISTATVNPRPRSSPRSPRARPRPRRLRPRAAGPRLGSTQSRQPPRPATSSSLSSPALSGKTSAYFTHPTHGSSILLSLNGQWKAFSAICTHRPCTLEFVSSELYCPCHGATFNATNGSVTRGPAQATLGEYGVIEQNGALYVSDSVIN